MHGVGSENKPPFRSEAVVIQKPIVAPRWWNDQEPLTILQFQFTNGLEIVSQLADIRRVPKRSIRVQHCGTLSTSDEWSIRGTIILGLHSSVQLNLGYTTDEITRAFGLNGSAGEDHEKFCRLAQYLLLPGNAGAYNLSVRLSDEMTAHLRHVLSEYGPLQKHFRASVPA